MPLTCSTSETLFTQLTAPLAKLADEAIAWYISAHIISGYTFLANNWRPGDRVCFCTYDLDFRH